MKYTVAVILLTLVINCKVPRKTPPNYFANNPVVAHRGAWKTQGYPENSLAALREAINLGCTGSEFDVWMTADDSLVVNHDHDYFGLSIEKSTYQELLPYKLTNDENLPTAREYLLEGLRQNGQTKLVFEIKPSQISKNRGRLIAEKAFHLVNELEAQDQVIFISFDLGIIERILELDPKAHCQYLRGDLRPSELKKKGIQGLDYYYKSLRNKEEWLEEAKEKGIYLNAWTVNRREDLQWMLEKEFDYITTNEPELCLQLYYEQE